MAIESITIDPLYRAAGKITTAGEVSWFQIKGDVFALSWSA